VEGGRAWREPSPGGFFMYMDTTYLLFLMMSNCVGKRGREGHYHPV